MPAVPSACFSRLFLPRSWPSHSSSSVSSLLPSSLHPFAFAPCPAPTGSSSPLSQFAVTLLLPLLPQSPTAPDQTPAPVGALPWIGLSPGLGFVKLNYPEFAFISQALRASWPTAADLALNSAASVQKILCSNHTLDSRITPLRKKKERKKKLKYFGVFRGRQHKIILAHSKQAPIKSSSERGYSSPCSKQTIVSWQ